MTLAAVTLLSVTADLDVLLRRVARHDADAFAALYDATRSRVFGLVTRVLRDRGYSEETTQEVYLQVWRSADSYDPASGSALSWLMTLAHRRAVDRVRSEQAAGVRESRYGAASAEPAVDIVSDAVIVSDQGNRKVVDHPDFAAASAKLGTRLSIHNQPNLGGSGGSSVGGGGGGGYCVWVQ